MRAIRIGLRPIVASAGLALVLFAACQSQPEPAPLPAAPPQPQPQPAEPRLLKNEIPAQELAAVTAAHYAGLGYMEQFNYKEAIACFREVVKRAPGWIPGSINLAIALLNFNGVKAEEAKKAGGDAKTAASFDEALALLADVLLREPDNRHAHFCTGLILQQQGEMVEAHRHFLRVTELDPTDPAGWYWAGATLSDSQDPTALPTREIESRRIVFFQNALRLNPYLSSAIYRLSRSYAILGQRKQAQEVIEQWRKLNPDREGRSPGPGDEITSSYGEAGRYSRIVNPLPALGDAAGSAAPEPRFEPGRAAAVTLPAGQRWVKVEDFQGPLAVVGRVRERAGAAIAALDANGDGKRDLLLASAVIGPKGVHDCLLINEGEGRFVDRTLEFGLPEDRGSIGIAAADFDADKQIDLFLTGVGGNRLLRNQEGRRFVDVSNAIKSPLNGALSLGARWLDLDQDGDLDLYVINYCAAGDAPRAFGPGEPPPGLANTVYRNDGLPPEIPNTPLAKLAPAAVAVDETPGRQGLSLDLKAWPDGEALAGGPNRHTAMAALDIDADRDLDLVLVADGAMPQVALNDRLGKFHVVQPDTLKELAGATGLLAFDFDADGRVDLAGTFASRKLVCLRNRPPAAEKNSQDLHFEAWPTNVLGWRTAQAVDLDLDGRLDLAGLPARPKDNAPLTPAWARNEGRRLAALNLPARAELAALEGLALVDIVGDPLPDLVLAVPGGPPIVARNLGNGQRYLALELGGHWDVKPTLMRTNSHAIGAQLLIEGQGIHATYDHTTPDSGLAQSVTPVVIGLGDKTQVELLHVRWPDGVLQCELNLAADQKIHLFENNRKTGSCPVLFTWNGRGYDCLGDFLGGGGLGYLVAPGVYGEPDRDESMLIEEAQLQAAAGEYRISVAEPMDEVVYLDHLALDVIDRPPGVSLALDERFAPEGPRPSGEVRAWKTTIRPVRATDLDGRDVTSRLERFDRVTVDDFPRLSGWIGYAREHGVVLDFGDRLSQFGPEAELLLGLAGWVEYPYSQTNYAAATAGYALRPPLIERLDEQGRFQVIEPHAGYPAGLPRMTTIPLTGKLTGKQCVLRIRTNMECYYDQAFIAVRDRSAEQALRRRTIAVSRAELRRKGYLREASPDGRLPLLYSYEHVDPAPLARLKGRLTRFGDVTELLTSDDDRFCVIGPGDEAQIAFPAAPPPPPGWARSFVLRSYGYCKDADPCTAGSDSVEPIPWRGMPDYPFANGVTEPRDPTRAQYLRQYQTRPAGGR